MNRAFIWAIALGVVFLAFLAFGYAVLPEIVENKVSELIQKSIGSPARVKADFTPAFIFTGMIREIRLFSPTFQINGIVLRQLDLKIKDVNLGLLSTLLGKFRVDSIGKSEGKFFLLSSDINNYLALKGRQERILVRDHSLFVTTIRPVIGKLTIEGRLELIGSKVTFIPETLEEPKSLVLLMQGNLWRNITFSIDFTAVDDLINFDRVFIDKEMIVVFFSLKDDLLKKMPEI